MHFIHQYIGNSWIAGENDCYSFIKKIWRNHYDIMGLPDYVYGDNPIENRKIMQIIDKKYFLKIQKPEDGDAVIMKQGKYPSHVGLWIGDLQGILHCIEKTGVIFTKPQFLYLHGFKIDSYYRARI